MTVMSSLPESALSFAVSLKTYVPTAENVAVAFRDVGVVNVTVPGPLTFVQETVTSPGGDGRPSSETDPASVAVCVKRIDWSGPALAVGG